MKSWENLGRLFDDKMWNVRTKIIFKMNTNL